MYQTPGSGSRAASIGCHARRWSDFRRAAVPTASCRVCCIAMMLGVLPLEQPASAIKNLGAHVDTSIRSAPCNERPTSTVVTVDRASGSPRSPMIANPLLNPSLHQAGDSTGFTEPVRVFLCTGHFKASQTLGAVRSVAVVHAADSTLGKPLRPRPKAQLSRISEPPATFALRHIGSLDRQVWKARECRLIEVSSFVANHRSEQSALLHPTVVKRPRPSSVPRSACSWDSPIGASCRC